MNLLTAPFFLQENEKLIDARWREKCLIASEILGVNPSRALRPEILGDRLKLDLMFWNGKLGIRNRDDEFFEIKEPDSTTPIIREMMKEFLSDPPPAIEKAQIRFRNSPCGEHKGIWIDVANEDIKNLKEEGAWIRRYIEEKKWILEAGQKGKAFFLGENEIVFDEAPYLPWLESYDANNDSIPLLSTINQFSQPGPEVNRALIAVGFELLYEILDEISTWAEFGAGYGNLTAAYASLLEGRKAWTCEVQPQAVRCLNQNAEKFFPRVHQSHSAAKLSWLPERADLWIIDPPRSGFPELFKELMDYPLMRPSYVLTYHCHSKGLLADSSLLKAMGYKLLEWSCVDAFPATPHHEVISLWKI